MSPTRIPPFEEIFSFENLLKSWREFRHRKKQKADVAKFSSDFIHNLASLHQDLMFGRYRHGGYHFFKIADPKPRDIHKASVRDRVVHHALYRSLYPYFDTRFIYDSYSCRVQKGTHRALYRLESLIRKVGKNGTLTVWVLKCDIKKCFASVDRAILKEILKKHILCPKTMKVLNTVIDSFYPDRGIPLGNLTSQLFINIYLHELDQAVKNIFKAKHYIRYADDFVVLSADKSWLEELLPKIADFLSERLRLELHPDKISIKTVASGIDFLGWVHFPNHRVLRTATKRRMFKRVEERKGNEATLQSYLGLLSHGNARKLQKEITNLSGQ
jgi:retron-type reverse transcriptase